MPDTQQLQDEVSQLRDEIQKLKEQQNGQKQNGDGDNKDGDDDKKKQEEDKKKQEEDKHKPPLRQRVGAWVKSHPMAVVLGLIGLVVVVIAGWILWNYLESYENTDDAEIAGHITQVSSRVSGRVVGVYVEDTQQIAKGQTVVDLDPRDYELALQQAEANLGQALAGIAQQQPNVPITTTSQATNVAAARLDVDSAEAALLAAQHEYESAQADEKQAEATAANARAEEVRYRELVEQEEVSREQYDQRATNARTADATVLARQASARAAQRTVDQRKAAVDTARQRAVEAERNQPRQIEVQHASVVGREAQAKAAEAQVNQAKLNLSYCKIFAPYAGIVGDKTVEVGMQVAIGQELFALTDLNDLWVTANFKETQIRNMHPGQSVSIKVDALAQTFNGYVENLPGATGAQYSLLPPENATGNYVKVVQRLPVRIRFKPNQPHAERLRPGMSVEPKVWVN
jgi:membrane fusion protein (multidrug efflux system)